MAKNTKYNGKKGYHGKRKPKGKEDFKSNRPEPETSAVGDNDPSWYIPDPMVMDQATRMSFANFIGVEVDFDPTNSLSDYLVSGTLMPGAAMQIFMNPSPGFTTSANPKAAAINQQAFRTYARLSSINAKNTLYTPNDVATVILALGELISMFAVAQRAYGLLWTYNVRNRNMPKTLVDLSGVNVNLLSPKAADYLTELNTLIVEANKIPFPANIEYFKHCNQMYSGIYQDSASSMSELYVPIPYSTWDLEEDLVLEGTVLKTHKLYNPKAGYVPMDPFALLQIIRTKIEKLLTSSTYNLVYSDILNLAAKDSSVSLLSFMPVDPQYAVMPTYDTEILLKLNNATILGEPLDRAHQSKPGAHTPDNDVLPYKDILSLVYAPQWERHIPDLGMLKLINFYNDSPTLEERVIATRWMAGSGLEEFDPLKKPKAGDPIDRPTLYTNDTVGMGDHYIVSLRVITNDSSDGEWYVDQSGVETDTEDTPTVLTRFSQHPYIYEFYYDEVDSGKFQLMGLVGDLDFYSTLDFDTLARINKLALFALFDVKDVIQRV